MKGTAHTPTDFVRSMTMTNLTIRYRPSSKLLTIENSDLDYGADEFATGPSLHHPSSDKTEAMVIVDYIERNGELMFVNLASFDCFTRGASWTLWLSEFVSDADIHIIEGLIANWERDYVSSMSDAELMVKLMFTYDTVLSVTLNK